MTEVKVGQIVRVKQLTHAKAIQLSRVGPPPNPEIRCPLHILTTCGKVFYVGKENIDNRGYLFNPDGEGWYYHPAWLELIEEDNSGQLWLFETEEI